MDKATLDNGGCVAKVWRGFHYFRCCAAGKVERDGKHYCLRHDPVKVAEREEVRKQQIKREIAERDAANEKSKKESRRAKMFKPMLETLKKAVECDSHDSEGVPALWLEEAEAVIAEAESI